MLTTAVLVEEIVCSCLFSDLPSHLPWPASGHKYRKGRDRSPPDWRIPLLQLSLDSLVVFVNADFLPFVRDVEILGWFSEFVSSG